MQFCVTYVNAVSLPKGTVGYFIVSFATEGRKAVAYMYSARGTVGEIC